MFEFMNFDYLSDGEIDLVIEDMAESCESKGYLPAYKYEIRLHNGSDRIGGIDVRIGHNKNTYYGGNIGYEVEEAYRGNHYAAKACNLIKQVAQAHRMDKLIITNDPINIPSRKTCEYIGARLVEIVDLPEDNEMYQLGDRQKCRYEWVLERNMFEVRRINPEMTYSIRHSVLRPHQTIGDCKRDTDHEDNAFHVGAFYHEKLISVASFCLERHPDFPIEVQYRLRAMATLDEYRNIGAGRSVVNYAENIIKELGIDLLWCKGRTTAQEYYIRLGFKTYGEVFDYPPIGPHIIMYKKLI